MAASERILIAGMGLVTPLGPSCWSTMRALLDGRSITDRLALAEAGIDPVQLAISIGGVPGARRTPYDPTVGLAERAAIEAAHDAGVEMLALAEAPLIVASGHGAVHAIDDPLIAGERLDWSPPEFMLNRIMKRLGVRAYGMAHAGPTASFQALEHARRLLLEDRRERVLLIATEAALTADMIEREREAHALPPMTPDEYRARPLDRTSRGRNPCELAAAMVLERAPRRSRDVEEGDAGETLKRALSTRGAEIELINVDFIQRTAPGNDTPAQAANESDDLLTHVVGRAMNGLHVEIVHAHAEGIAESDAAELASLGAAFGDRLNGQRVYSSKGSIGAAAGAGGLASMILAATIGRSGRLPAMPWLTDPIETDFILGAAAADGHWPRHLIIERSPIGDEAAAAVIHIRRARNRSASVAPES